ncbi:MFS transporter [Streptomyces sp. NPDC020379]|uniref:MFS transporter n=1 Tax=Streptomyces sp. NPDC020379 TaxID=3365071 RepID=UPI0037BAEC55
MPFALVVAAFWSAFDRFAVAPMLFAVAVSFHARLSEAVAVASGYFLAYGCLQPVWGMLSDRFGRVCVLRAALVGATIGGVVSVAAPSLAVLLVARCVTGACYGGVNPSVITYVGDTVAPDTVKRVLSPFYAAGGAGTAAGIALGGILAGLGDWRIAFALPMAAAAVLFLVLLRLPEPDHAPSDTPARQIATVLRSRWALLVIAAGLLMGCVVVGCVTFLPSMLQHHGSSASVAGLLTAVYGLAGLAWAPVYNGLSRRRVPRWVLVALGGVLITASMLVAAAGPHLATVVIAAVLLGGGWIFNNVSLASWATAVVPHARGTAVSLYATGLFVGGGVTPVLAAGLAERGDYPVIFLTGACVAGLTAAVASVGDRRFSALGARAEAAAREGTVSRAQSPR